MHVVVRGTLIGGAVGAVLAVVRGRGGTGGTNGNEAESSAAGRYAKSIAEGALAGAAVGFVLDRRLRAGAVPRVVELAEQAYGAARPRVLELAELARERASDLRAS